MTRFVFCLIVGSLPAAVWAAEPLQSRPAESRAASPSETPAGIESCFGASGEKDEDLKTGNEDLIQQMLRQMLSPGS